eukprot:Anaeramoba_ignava/a240359_9.p1 GENE.a240359_9~~a240359_9.p1  ORF type:complete len:135 (-),score=41.97 a240359_9:42-446(-)
MTMNLKNENKSKHQTIIPKKNNIKITWTDFNSNRRIIRIGFENEIISGFCFTIAHSSEGFVSQPKNILITMIVVNEIGEIQGQIMVGKYFIPKCPDGTLLNYDLEEKLRAQVIEISFLSNYGGDTLSCGHFSFY